MEGEATASPTTRAHQSDAIRIGDESPSSRFFLSTTSSSYLACVAYRRKVAWICLAAMLL